MKNTLGACGAGLILGVLLVGPTAIKEHFAQPVELETQQAGIVDYNMPTPMPTERTCPATSYTLEVEPGDSLWSIAELCGTTVEKIRQLNGLAQEDDTIYAGTTLIVR